MKGRTPAIILGVLTLLVMVACGGSSNPPTSPSPAPSGPQTGTPPPTDPTPDPPGTPPPTNPPPNNPPTNPPFTPTGHRVRVTAVGDVGMCSQRDAVERVAALVLRLSNPLLLLVGDLAYMQGSLQQFRECFDPAWGKFREFWRPVPGNHEYETQGAAGYRQYFGDQAGAIGRTYYAFRTGDWLVIMIDSNEAVGVASQQYEFVRNTLRSTNAPCTMAVWHHPLFTSGPNGNQTYMRDMWRLLYDNNADVIVNGHDHLYERFGKQDPNGRSDVRGLRQFIVGTGGAQLYAFQRQEANSQSRISRHGVLQFVLDTDRYAWEFVEAGTNAVLDSGTDGCH